MANICSNVMWIYTDKSNEANLKKVYEILQEAAHSKDENYMIDIICKLRPELKQAEVEEQLEKHDYEYRSWIDGSVEYNEATAYRPAHIVVYYESKWYPTIEAWNLGLEPYGVDQVTVAEEPGNGIYINTDKDHVFCGDKYVIDIYTCDDENDTEEIEFKEYFEAGDEERMIKYFNEDVGEKISRKFKSVEEIRDYIKDLRHRIETGWAIFEEFTTEY